MPLFSALPLSLPELAAALRSRETLAFPPEAIARLQAGPAALPGAAPDGSLVLAHTYGTGPEVPPELVRRMLLLTVQRLSHEPGAQLATAKRLLDFFNRDVWPVVPEQGGEAAAQAHLGLPLLGLGEVDYQGYRLAAADVLGLFGWAPVPLAPAEAPVLLAGQPLALAYATEALERTQHLLAAAAVLGALSAEIPSSQAITEASHAAVAGVAQVVAAACNATAPTSSPAWEALPLAPALGRLACAVADLAAASAQRTAQGLPPAEPTPGPDALHLLPHAAAALAAQTQLLARPAAASPALSAGYQGPLAGRQARQTVADAEQVLGMELLAAAQAPDQRPPAYRSPALAAAVAAFREHVTFVGRGQVLAPALQRAARFVREYSWG